MSTLKTNAIQSTGGKPLLHSTGSILQVVSTYKGDHFQTNSTSWTDISGMSCSITPSDTGNKILVWACFGGCSVRQSTLDHGHGIRTLRNNSNSNKCNGTAAGNRDISSFKGNGWSFNADHNPGGLGFHALDDPGSTSQQTYKLQVKCQSSNYAFNLNGPHNNGDTAYVYAARQMSSLTLMEVSA